MPKIIHYRSKCIGCGVCQEIQPQYWRMSRKDGKATLLHSAAKKGIYSADIDISACQKTKELVRACPVRVIKLN